VETILRKHGVTEGSLVIDDSDKKRSKTTTRIWGVHKLKDKSTGGYVQGQSIVLLLLVTPTITVPVGFASAKPLDVYVAGQLSRGCPSFVVYG
jgi:hypothetical protein